MQSKDIRSSRVKAIRAPFQVDYHQQDPTSDDAHNHIGSSSTNNNNDTNNNNKGSNSSEGKRNNWVSTGPFTTSQELNRMQTLLHENVEGVQFCIDGALGLPISSTATRVTVRLIDSDWNQIGENNAASLSHPDSNAFEPAFDLHMSWRGMYMAPTGTLVCRIDTLERPSLAAKCIGFAALKMFVDRNGDQPTINTPLDEVYLNTGKFDIPIVYGTISTDGELCEDKAKQLPHIHKAHLCVRLFNPNILVR